ncbi:unnamed protein product [Rhizophagus irregularis]|nr:unnamed protein product [Rhizophagus irregularis]
MDKEEPCCLVLPHSVVEVSGTEIDTSMCIVRTCDENNETNGLCRKSRPMVVDTIIKSNRNSVATSLGHELQGQYQDDDIDYVKESSCMLY